MGSRDLDLLRRLTAAFGPSGREDEVAELVTKEISGLCDEIINLPAGGILAILRGSASGEKPRRILIDAHIDEVGFMVQSAEDDGTLRFGAVGGIDPRVLCGRRVVILGEKTGVKIKGLISSKPPHLQSESERSETTPIDKMYIDIGARSKEEAEQHVSPGDWGTFDSEFVEFGDGYIKAKALDDRLGCAIMIKMLKRLKEEGFRPASDYCFAFTVGEEIGMAGASGAAWRFAADYALVLESTAVADIPDVPEHEQAAKLGGGGVVSIADRGTIYDREMVDFIMSEGEKHSIPCQLKRFISGGNDAAVIHRSRDGVRTAAISVPTRYLHTASNVISCEDYFSMTELVYRAVVGLDEF